MKIAIAGYGIEGEQNYKYWLNAGHEVTIVDEKSAPDKPLPENAVTVLGPDSFSDLSHYDLVVRTAGLSPRKLQNAKRIWSATNEFFEKCSAPIIGVTGTKGKGTTASLIHSILTAAGKKSHLVGNIGTPALNVLAEISPDDIVVYELSSFQLWDLEVSPHTAVVLMIEPDHLDVHTDFADYVNAKANITLHQTTDDYLVFNNQNDTATHIAIASTARKIPYPDQLFAHIRDKSFYYGEHKICSVEALRLPGAHNIDNACAAISAIWPYVQDEQAIRTGIAAFEGLDHRLKFVREVGGVKYFDDSIATTPGSAIAAIHAFEEPKVLILGGSDKGVGYDTLVDKVLETKSMRAVICVGEIGPKIYELFKAKGAVGGLNLVEEKSIEAIVAKAQGCAQSGDVVILSPAAASFDMFKSYADRGDRFIAAANQLTE